MKKLMLLAIVMYGISCSDPEDRATGDPDSTMFNANDKNNTNSGTEFNNPQGSAMSDTSAAPALDKKNTTSPTHGTNRAYADSTKK
jgi:hypothetical protein